MTPPSAHAFRVQGDILTAQGNWSAGTAAYERAVSIEPNYLDALVKLAGSYAQHGKPAQAIDIYTKLVALAPGYAVPYNNLAYLRASQGTADAETLALAERALALAPEYAEAMHTLGRVRLQRNECGLALKPLTDARARLGDRFDVLLDLGTCYEKLGRKSEATNVYARPSRWRPLPRRPPSRTPSSACASSLGVLSARRCGPVCREAGCLRLEWRRAIS